MNSKMVSMLVLQKGTVFPFSILKSLIARLIIDNLDSF